jgi:hypothetical protein
MVFQTVESCGQRLKERMHGVCVVGSQVAWSSQDQDQAVWELCSYWDVLDRLCISLNLHFLIHNKISVVTRTPLH